MKFPLNPDSTLSATEQAKIFLLLTALPIAAQAQMPFTGVPIPIPGTWEAENFDLGGEGIAYHDFSEGNQGHATYRTGEDVDIFVSNDAAGGQYIVKNFESGEWMGYTVDVPMTGQYDIEVRATTNPQFPGRAYHIEIDGVDVTGWFRKCRTSASTRCA